MSCFFPCFRNKEEEEDVGKEQLLVAQPPALLGSSSPQATPAAFPNKGMPRMKIASGVAQGLEYLHEKANPPIIYRDLKSSTILLDQDFNPKLSDYGLAKLEGRGSNTLLTPGVMGTGYCAPEYERTGELTLKSDVYSFGVVLVELISGRRAVDPAGTAHFQRSKEIPRNGRSTAEEGISNDKFESSSWCRRHVSPRRSLSSPLVR